mgnify:CR=1 FL=1
MNAVKSSDGVLDVDFRLQHANGEFQWVNLSGSITFDENKERSRVVGCIHNVHQHKLLEQAQKRKQIYDSITSFYRLGSGLEVVETLCRDDPEGVLVLLEIQQFSKIDERYGLIFGDIILEQFAGLLAKRFQEDGLNGGIYIRAGADQMLVWLPVCTDRTGREKCTETGKGFWALTDEKYLSLSLKCGIAVTGSRNSLSEALEQTKTALTAARHGKQEIMFYEELSAEEKACAADVAFAEVASLERLKEMTLSSIALNLFDRDGDTSVVLDILALKLQEKYHLTDIVITHFNGEYMVNNLLYCWKTWKKKDGWDGMVHCSEKQYQHFVETQEMQQLLTSGESIRKEPLIQPFASGRNDIVFHMTDNGQYSGSIVFQDIDQDVLEKKEKSAYADWFMIHDWETVEKRADTRDGRFYSFAFTDGMPKLNTNNEEVIQYFCKICEDWIRKFDIDGIRFDVGNEVSHRFLKKLREHLKQMKPDLYLLGEIWHDASQWLLGDEYDSVMNYPLMSGIHDFFLDRGMEKGRI